MICKKCGCKKPPTDFYPSSKTRCKECIKSSVASNRMENLERVRAYDRMRSSMPHRVAARAEYSKTQAYAESHAASAKRWVESHPERKRATTKLNNALRDGRIKKLPCLVCGGISEAHHPDYDRPLDVVWLCAQHHKQAHAASKGY